MDGSRVTHSLDFLWFYTNVLTCTDEPVASSTDQCSPSTIAEEPPKSDLQKPNTPLILLNQQQHDESQHAEHFTPRCHRCGEIVSSALEEDRVMMHGDSEMVKSLKETKRRDRRKRRNKWNKSGLNGVEVILGGLDLGFDVKEVSGFLKFQEESYEYQMLKTKLPPFDDDVAMKQHLKSWAYAVACTVK